MMSFQEKSAWIMSLALLLGSAFYFGVATGMSFDIGQLARPTMPAVAIYTIVLIVIAIVGHVVIAAAAPKDATAPLDERERQIFTRAGHVSGYLFGIGVIASLGLYLLSYSGDALFYCVFASLMLAQLAEYAVRIYLYRAAL